LRYNTTLSRHSLDAGIAAPAHGSAAAQQAAGKPLLNGQLLEDSSVSSKHNQAGATGMTAATAATKRLTATAIHGGSAGAYGSSSSSEKGCSSSLRWCELQAELQAMNGDLDAAEAALQAATARLGNTAA
jgi:hypothetical protein